MTIEWKSEPTEVVSTLATAEDGIAMLPQPYVTVAQGSVEGLRIAIDLTEAWDALNNGSMLFTGVLLVRKGFRGEPSAGDRGLFERIRSLDGIRQREYRGRRAAH